MSTFFFLNAIEASQVLVSVRSLLDKAKFEQLASAGDDSLVDFEESEVFTVQNVCNTLQTMLNGAHVSVSYFVDSSFSSQTEKPLG